MWWRRPRPSAKPWPAPRPAEPAPEPQPAPRAATPLPDPPALAPLDGIPPWPVAAPAKDSGQSPAVPAEPDDEDQPEFDFSAPEPQPAPGARDQADAEPTTGPGQGDGIQEPAWRALAAAREQALEVYARYRLPQAPALYRRSGDRHAWRPADENLTAEQRWEFVLNGSEGGWRLVGLERVGRIGRTRVIEVQMAASILSLTEALTRRLDESDPGARADMVKAFELGRLTAAAEARAEMVRRRKRRRARLKARARGRPRQDEPAPPDPTPID